MLVVLNKWLLGGGFRAVVRPPRGLFHKADFVRCEAVEGSDVIVEGCFKRSEVGIWVGALGSENLVHEGYNGNLL